MSHKSLTSRLAGISLILLILLLSVALVSCGSDSTTGTSAGSDTTSASPTDTAPSAGEAQELIVSAASSLKNAFTEIGAAFDQANGTSTTFNFDASGTLQKQVEAGAPVDVFAAAAPTQVNNLLKQNLVDEATIVSFASNEIVLAVPADSKLEIASVEDLVKPEVEKVAYGDPVAAPHGVYAEEVMTTLGILEQVKPKVVYTKNASQTLTYVTSGEVDVGIMYSTDAVAGGDKVKVVATSQPDWHSQIIYPIAVVSATKAKTLAQDFIDFVMGTEGQSILQKHGFVAATTG